MSSIEIKPASGFKIKDPIAGNFLPPEGRIVEVSDYWTRRLRDGDVVYTTNSSVRTPPSIRQSAKASLAAGGAVVPSVMLGGSSFLNQLTNGAASASAATTYEHVRYVGRKPVACMVHYKHNVSGGGARAFAICNR